MKTGYTKISFESLRPDLATDEERFGKGIAQAEARADAYFEACSPHIDDVVRRQAEKCANRINNGESTYGATRAYENIIRTGDKNPDSSYYQQGEKYWKLFCAELRSRVVGRWPVLPAWNKN